MYVISKMVHLVKVNKRLPKRHIHVSNAPRVILRPSLQTVRFHCNLSSCFSSPVPEIHLNPRTRPSKWQDKRHNITWTRLAQEHGGGRRGGTDTNKNMVGFCSWIILQFHGTSICAWKVTQIEREITDMPKNMPKNERHAGPSKYSYSENVVKNNPNQAGLGLEKKGG